MAKNPIQELVVQYKEKDLDRYDYIDKMHNFNKTLFYLSERLKDTDIAKIEILDGLLLFTTRKDGIKMTFNGVARRGVPYEILNFEYYEREDEGMLFSVLDDDAVILDIGANVGWYSLLFSKRLPRSMIYAFEPITETFKNLSTNIALNKAVNVFPLNFGLSDKKGLATYYYFPEGSVLASERNIIDCPKAKQIKCENQTLDEFVRQYQIKKVDLIKCDIEGAELSALKGGMRSIQEFLPVIFIELCEKWTVQFQYHPNDVIDFLKDLGYECFFADENGLESCPFYRESKEERFNFFFLHSKKHCDLIERLACHALSL